MIKYSKSCNGCRACEQVCPVNAIAMIENEEGFFYPEVDLVSCINCNLCNKKCHLETRVEAADKIQSQTYVAINKNKKDLRYSSSGGFFMILAKYVMNLEGVVFGCAYDEKMLPSHIRVERGTDLQKLQGSKYVESDLKNCYTNILKELLVDKWVLFSGTGCQVAGLKSFLGKNYEKLLLIDIVCHGVPSRKMFLEHLTYLNNKYQDKIVDFKFRDKSLFGWGKNITYLFQSKKIKRIQQFQDVFMMAFNRSSNYRENCYTCQYLGKNRFSDFTIGDYWGVEKFHPDIPIEEGVSVVIVHTKIGKDLLEILKAEMILIESQIDFASQDNHNIMTPTVRPKERDLFYQQLKQVGYKTWATDYYRSKMYLKLMLQAQIKGLLKKILPKSLIKIIKKR